MADGLGSVRIQTDGAGAVDKCYDYLPFGEALVNGVNGRPACYSQVSTPAVDGGGLAAVAVYGAIAGLGDGAGLLWGSVLLGGPGKVDFA